MDGRALPSGTATFVFTDVEGSTPMLRNLGHQRYEEVLNAHREIVREALDRHRGVEVKTEGDGFFLAFAEAADALAACVDAQRGLVTKVWPAGVSLRVRMGLHTGEAVVTADRDYVGEDVHAAARVASAAHGGQVLLSSATRAALAGTPPGVGLVDLGRWRLRGFDEPFTLHQLLHPDLPSTFPPVRAASAVVHNLPILRTTFVGREEERNELRKMLDVRPLVTAVGPGGVGKTRLALEVAKLVTGDFDDGVWLVELASVTDQALVDETVARALGIADHAASDASARVVDHLRDKTALLVLDNAEHVVDACAHLVDTVLRECPAVVVLATSRERLGVRGEQVWTVPPLALPDGNGVGAERAFEIDAVRLFTDRAQASDRSFRLDEDVVADVVEICRRLDGIPLALELAAALVGERTPREIRAELDDRFALLTSGYRTDAPRQRTLWGAIEWSHELLSGRERVVLRRIGVFRGGFTEDAATAVVVDGDDLEVPDVRPALDALVHRSLVDVDTTQEPVRFRILESIREFSVRKLREAAESGFGAHRHRQWALAFALEADGHLPMADAPQWFSRFEAEHDNCREAIESAADDPAAGVEHLDLVAALGRFWEARGYLREGAERIRHAIERSPAPTSSRVRALIAKGRIDLRMARVDDARIALTEARALSAELGDNQNAAVAGLGLASIAIQLGEYDGAAVAYRGAITTYELLDMPTGSAAAWSGLGFVALHQDRLEEARTHYEQSLSMYREAEHGRGIAHCLANLAEVARLQGDPERAMALLHESVEVANGIGDMLVHVASLSILGSLLVERGDDDEAVSTIRGALQVIEETGFSEFASKCHQNLSMVAHRKGDRAGAAHSIRQALDSAVAEDDPRATGTSLEIIGFLAVEAVEADACEAGCKLMAAAVSHRADSDHNADVRETALATAKTRLGGRFAVIYREGAELSIESAVALGRSVAERLGGAATNADATRT